ncbi:MAG: GNAT family N-acetyltransferase [Niameybacter sp.]|nr:GNAT family N-acetyltransferase [Niameybacter sp.]
MIYLEEINKHNFRESFSLKVAETQKNFVATVPVALARAYVYRESAEALAVYHDHTMIGFVLIREQDNAYIIDQFMIDERYQGKGYGKEAMRIIIERLRTPRKRGKIILCYCEDDYIARNLYKALGFRNTGERDEDEIIMELIL